MAAVVVGDDPKVTRESFDLAMPQLGGLHPAVDQDEGGEILRAVNAHVAIAAVGSADGYRSACLGGRAARVARPVRAASGQPCVQTRSPGQAGGNEGLVSGWFPHSGGEVSRLRSTTRITRSAPTIWNADRKRSSGYVAWMANLRLPIDLAPITDGLKSISETLKTMRDSVAILPEVAKTLEEIRASTRIMADEVHLMRVGVDGLADEVEGMRAAVEPLVPHMDVVAARIEASSLGSRT